MIELSECLKKAVQDHINDVGRGKYLGSYHIAMSTVKLLSRVVTETPWNKANDLLNILHSEGIKLINGVSNETTVRNMVFRVLKIIRDEYGAGGNIVAETPDSLHQMMNFERSTSTESYGKEISDLRPRIMEALEELVIELETSAENIAAQALQHIHANEIIMTIGKSKTVEAFLKKAAEEKRKFQVIVAECAPFYHGQELALSLAKASIDTTVITDSAIFAMMARVNKVIIGTHAVMADGGLKAVSGAHTMALAAKHYSVPFIVCSPMFKLTPSYVSAQNHEEFNMFVSPESITREMDGSILSNIHVYNPVFDYVPPQLVTLFISNVSGFAPSYIYRLLAELYHPNDYNLN